METSQNKALIQPFPAYLDIKQRIFTNTRSEHPKSYTSTYHYPDTDIPAYADRMATKQCSTIDPPKKKKLSSYCDDAGKENARTDKRTVRRQRRHRAHQAPQPRLELPGMSLCAGAPPPVRERDDLVDVYARHARVDRLWEE